MKLTPQEIDHVAHLARLSLTDKEKEQYAEQLSVVFDYIDQLKEVDTSEDEEEIFATEKNIFREDIPVVQTDKTRAAIIDAFPMRDGNLLKVKAIYGAS